MNISKISDLQSVKPINSNKSNKTFLTAQKSDTFESVAFKGKNFNLDEALSELKSMKGLKDTPKFNDEKLDLIKEQLAKTPQKWEPFRNLVQNPKMISSIACDILKKDVNDLKNISEIASKKNSNDTYKFSPFDIKAIAGSLKGKEIERFSVLSDTDLGIDNLISLAKNDKLQNLDKVVLKVNEMKTLCDNEKLLDLKFDTDEYDKDNFAITANIVGGKKFQLLDKDLNTVSIEDAKNVDSPNGKQYQIKKTVDYRNNTISKVRLELNKKLPQPVLLSEIRIVKDKNGKTLRTEYTEQSEVQGVLNIKHVMPDGSEKVLSSSTIDKKTGITSVKKDMVSLDGTRTQYLYEDDPQGNRISDYKIVDKNGKVLLKNSQSFEVVSDNKFISSKNNEKYEITVNENEISVKDLNKDKISILKFENYIDGNREKIINVMKKMPGEELIALGESVKQLQGIDDILSSTYGAVNKRIKTSDNLFVMLHELGHAKDYNDVDVQQKETLKKSIFNNKEVNEIFEKEKAQFNKAFPNAQRDHINYFIKTSDVGDGVQEAIAESNAILNTYNNDDLFSIRSQYLQQFFPRTIAVLSNVLNK